MAREKKKNKIQNGKVDSVYLILLLVLLGIGLLMMFSASYPTAYYEEEGNALYYFLRQLTFAGIGLVGMFIASRIQWKTLRKLAWPGLILAVFLLILVLFIGKGNFGERRWIRVGGFPFQPSELAKFAIIFFFASYISAHSSKMKTFRVGMLPLFLILGLVCYLMYCEPHLSGMIIIAMIGMIMMFVGGAHAGMFGGLIAAGGAAGFVAVTTRGYASSRLAVWFDPFVDPKGAGWQAIQSLYAMGSGGLFGLGFGNSRQKYLYLPEAHNDFIFAVVCEELGFIGACIIMLLFALFILRGFWIATRVKDRFDALLVVGITSQIALQTLLNIGVVTGFLPVTGASLPFFSYGGTSLILLLVEAGIVLSASRRMKVSGPKSEELPEETTDGEEEE